jgi:hypothetical protein
MVELFEVITTDIKKLDIDPTVGLAVATEAPDWQNLIDLTIDRPEGLYEVNISLVWNYNVTSKSGMFRWTVDGGTTWLETSEEPKDKTDHRPFSVTFPVEHTGGTRNIKVEATRENDSYEMTMYFVSATFKRIG